MARRHAVGRSGGEAATGGAAVQRIFRVAALMAIWALAWIVAAQILHRIAPGLGGPGPGTQVSPGWGAMALSGAAVALCAGQVLGRTRRMRTSDAWTITLLLAVGAGGMALLAGTAEAEMSDGPATLGRVGAGLAPLLAAVTYAAARRRNRR